LGSDSGAAAEKGREEQIVAIALAVYDHVNVNRCADNVNGPHTALVGVISAAAVVDVDVAVRDR
jgi:hypothetical protein